MPQRSGAKLRIQAFVLFCRTFVFSYEDNLSPKWSKDGLIECLKIIFKLDLITKKQFSFDVEVNNYSKNLPCENLVAGMQIKKSGNGSVPDPVKMLPDPGPQQYALSWDSLKGTFLQKGLLLFS